MNIKLTFVNKSILSFRDCFIYQILKLIIRRKHFQQLSLTRTQHWLLVIDLRLDVGQRRQARTSTDEKIKWWHAPECKRDLAVALGATALDIDPNQPVEATWNHIADQIREAATSVLEKSKPGKRFIDSKYGGGTQNSKFP